MTAARIPVTDSLTSPTALLLGANAIAAVLFPGDPGGPRRVFYLSTETKSDPPLPVFRLGRQLAARPQALLRWIEACEKRALAGDAR